MFWNSFNPSSAVDTSMTAENNGALSNQSKMISSALRQADKAIRQANYLYPGKARATMNNPNFSDSSSSDDGSSSYGGTMADTTIKSGVESQTTAATLNLKHNDSQFYVIAGVVVSKFEHFLTSGANSFAVSADDKQHLDRIVSRDNLVEAVRYRLQNLPEKTLKPIHLLTLQCKALGLHRSGKQNLLYAPAGTIIEIEKLPPLVLDEESTWYTKDSGTTATKSIYSKFSESSLGRDLVLAELQEATNLMNASVTPEAAQFWRKHVNDLQSRLQIMQQKTAVSTTGTIALGAMAGCNEQIVSTLNDLSNYGTSQVNDSLGAWPTGQHARRSRHQKEESDSIPNPEFQGVPMIDVVAPANLPEGYTFEAEIDECRFVATVPRGGVRKGQTFACYMRDMEQISDSDIPVNKWRDSLFDFLNHGAAHPMFLNSFFCPLIALSQIMTRMGLDFMGLSGQSIPRDGLWSTRGMTLIILSSWVFLNFMIFVGYYIKNLAEVAISGADIVAFLMVNVGMLVYTVYAASNTRATIRKKYMIRQLGCGEHEDILLSYFCLPCSVAQMGRHTVAYDENRALCCSDTGLEEGVEADITAHPHVGSYRIW